MDILIVTDEIQNGDFKKYDDENNNHIIDAYIKGKKVATLTAIPGRGWKYELYCDKFHNLLCEVSGLYEADKLIAIQRQYPLSKSAARNLMRYRHEEAMEYGYQL